MNLLATAACVSLSASMMVLQAVEQPSIRGAAVAVEPVNAAADRIKKDLGFDIRVSTEGGNAAAVASMAQELADIALTSRGMNPRESAFWPGKNFVESQMGMQALAIVVPDEVWRSGVRSISREQLRGIYESKLTNWRDLGGDDRAIVFYGREVTGSVWEMLMIFLYEDVRKAPLSRAEILADSGEVATGVRFNSGSISVMELGHFREGPIHALGIKLPDGSVVEPTAANVASKRYPIARPLMMITSRKPTGGVRRFIDFMLGPVGQEFVKKTGHIPNAELMAEKQR